MDVTFADFENRLLPSLPGATRDAAMQAFFDTARTFYRRSRSWRIVLGALTIREGVDVIPLNPIDQNAEICFVEGYTSAAPGGFTIVRSGQNGVASASFNGHGYGLSVSNPHTVVITPTPRHTIERALYVEVSAQPRRGNTDYLPEIALTHHADGLEAGCLARMYMQKAKPYSDPAQAVFMGRRFEAEIARAIGNLRTNYGQHHTPWRYPTVPMR